MEHTVSDRGFKATEPITDDRRSVVSVYESSAAMRACIWLRVTSGDVYQPKPGEGVAHLTLEQAATLRDQLDWLIRNHYQAR